MSWSIHARGTKNEVKKLVGADGSIPEAVKSAVETVLVAMPEQQHIMMETHGQVGSLDANATIRISSVSVGKRV